MISAADTPIGFGKYAEMTVAQVAEFDPGYVVWLHDGAGRADLVPGGMYEDARLDLDELDEGPEFYSLDF